uniref:Uncharacterized protein n=1 Tax=Anopheles atroparvus TaxID=41427 RepID=A0A182JI22_ANOAO
MSLQVSNQGSTGGRRTPLVYQSFGGANVAAGAAGAGGGGGGPAANGAGGGNAAGGRSTKGGGAAGKQSQIPVAVGTVVAEVGSPSTVAPTPTAVVHPGSGGNSTPVGASADVPSLAFTAQKQQLLQQQQQQPQQFDLQYGGALKQQQAVVDTANKEQTTVGRKATNGSSNGAGGTVQPAVGGGSPVAKQADQTGPASNNGSNVGSDGGKVRDSPRSSGRTQQKASDEAQKTPEKPKEKQQTGGNKTPQKDSTGKSSLLAEKPLKGVDCDGEEMESLLLEPWEYEDSPMPSQQASAKSKLPKPGPTAHARVAPYKSTGKQGGDGQLVETVAAGEKSTPKATEAAPGTPPESSSIGRPLRSISGRRTTRPITEIRFTHHRKSTELNDSISSLNVTVGSDVYMDSLRTPGSATRKRKDMTPESTSDPVESPKRARLDFSGLLGIVASPVTMLKNRLSRVKLQPSTPRSLAVEEEDASKVVTAEATTTTAAGPAADDAAAATGKPMEVEGKDGEAPPAVAEKGDDTNAQQSTSSAAAVVNDGEDEVEVKIITDKQKQWCSVM